MKPSENAFTSIKDNRLGWLDGLRALAIIMVVWVHSGQRIKGIGSGVQEFAQAGQYGVQLFFVISAVSIYLSLGRQFHKGRSLKGWYLKRFLRIAPLYYFGLIFYTAYRYYIQDQNTPLMPILANLTFTHGFVPAGNNSVVPGGWSIAVEMAFYLVAPLVIYALRLRFWWALFLVAALSSLALTHFANSGLGIKNNGFLYFWPLTQAPIFLIAIGAAHVFNNSMFKGGERWGLTTITALLLSIFSVGLGLYFGTFGNAAHILAPTFMGLGGVALLFLANRPLLNIFSSRVAIWIGRHSYSIYLLHFIVLDGVRRLIENHSTLEAEPRFIVTFFATFLITCLLSTLSRYVLEAPFIRLGRKLNIEKATIRAA